MAGGMGKQELQEVCIFGNLLNTLLTRQFIIYFEIVWSKLRILRFLNENKLWVMNNCLLFLLLQGLEVIESTNLKYFSKEMTAEFFALKGMFLAYIGRYD